MEYDYIECGDCLELMKSIPDKSIDLVVTDPPYIIDNKGGGLYTQEDKQYVKQLEGIKDGFSTEVLDELCRVMKNINIYLWCSQKQLVPLIEYFVEGKKCNFNLITWHKTNPIPACGNKYLTDTEYCLHFYKGKGKKVHPESYEDAKTYYVAPINHKDKKIWGHPTIKPIDLTESMVRNCSNEGDLVLDPFIGSGTTAIACIRNNRDYIGFEYNEDFYTYLSLHHKHSLRHKQH